MQSVSNQFDNFMMTQNSGGNSPKNKNDLNFMNFAFKSNIENNKKIDQDDKAGSFI